MTNDRTHPELDPQQPGQQQQRQPGREHKMDPEPRSEMEEYVGAGKLKDQVAIVTGGDSGIGRAVSIGFAKEGADVAVVYLEEDQDAERTKELVEAAGGRCLLIRGDLGEPAFAAVVVRKTVEEFGRLDILVNHAGEQHVELDFEQIKDEQIHKTFTTNVFSMFYLTREALKKMGDGGVIVNTTSVTAYEGHLKMVDYAATNGAIVSFTRSLARKLVDRGIRVNAVAPGPVWTPLIPASFSEDKVEHFGENTPFGRPGQPDELAPSYIFLASKDSSYISGTTIHPNGARFVTT